MSFPEFYDPQQVGKLYVPDTARVVDAGRALGARPAEHDAQRIVLLLVDAQVDFVHPDGALSVPGAVEDARRTIEWLHRNLERVTTVAASLDSHIPIQIFFPTWWVGRDGKHPNPFTPISSIQVDSGEWQPLYLSAWSREYVHRLEQDARKELMIWPYHTLIGTWGHNITPALFEAIAFHSAARQSQPIFLTKGSIPETEHYSIMEPEVKVPTVAQGELNTDFLNMLASYDLIYIAGQAKSHCVLETVASTMRYFHGKTHLIEKLRVLIDATSPVTHPQIDFDAMADETFAAFEKEGLQLVHVDDTLG